MMRIHAKNILPPDDWARDIVLGIGVDGKIVSVGPDQGLADQTYDIILPAP